MTVEELRDQWLESLRYEFAGMLSGMSTDLASLVTAVEARGFAKGHAEGVAEGVEQMKETIRNAATFTDAVTADVRKFTHPPYPDNPMVVMTEASYTIPASVLVPKEKP